MSETMCTCGKPTAGAVLCDDCAKTFAYSLPNVAAYYADLGTVARKQTRYATGTATKGSIGKSQPIPVDMRFVNGAPMRQVDRETVGGAVTAIGNQLRWDAWNTVIVWCRTVMAELPPVAGPACGECLHVECATIRRRQWPANTMTSMVNYLSRQFRWIIRQQWAPIMFGELLDLEKRLSRFVDRPADRWYAGKCSATTLSDDGAVCTAELYATVERGTITCRACGTDHDVASRRDFLLSEAKDYLVTATEAAGALLAWTDYDGSEAKLIDRIRKWRDRGLLAERGDVEIGGKGRTLYRLGDIQEQMIAAAQRDQERRIGKNARPA